MHLRSAQVLALAVCGLLATTAIADSGSNCLLSSPNGQLQFEIFTDGDQLHYTVRFREQVIIEPSPLVMTTDGVQLTSQATVESIQFSKFDETYSWRGVHNTARNCAHSATLALEHESSGTAFTIDIRAYDDGVAFRFDIPSFNNASRVPGEATEFRLPADSTVWLHDMRGHYEGVHAKHRLEEISAGQWAAPPITFKLPGQRGYGSITEAALVHYPGMALRATGNEGFRIVLGPEHPVSTPFRLRYEEDIERLAHPAAISGAITTPWRVILIGQDLNTLVNADVVHNLCPPPDPELFPQGMDTVWVKPGRAVWRYLDGGDRSLEGMKGFSGMAGELGFEYHVIEGFWSNWSDEEVRELVDYSRAHGVGLWFWKHSKELRTAAARDTFFRQLSDWGVVGAKIDFFDHEHQEVVDHYADLLHDAARYHILVNFHGANKPTGEARTWPNELVREAIKGMESRRLSNRAQHDATVPFTRLLAGHADYTPLHFGDRRGDTTWTHQIATAAVFTAPLLTYAAHPQSLLNNPAAAMVKNIPATWDETRVLPPSEIGKVAVFARRSGNTWFLAVVNGPHGRSLDVPLSFLAEGTYSAYAVRDRADDAAALDTEKLSCTKGDSIAIELSDGGGFIARFEKEPAVITAERPRSDR